LVILESAVIAVKYDERASSIFRKGFGPKEIVKLTGL
jgi:hypothetical protein